MLEEEAQTDFSMTDQSSFSHYQSHSDFFSQLQTRYHRIHGCRSCRHKKVIETFVYTGAQTDAND